LAFRQFAKDGNLVTLSTDFARTLVSGVGDLRIKRVFVRAEPSILRRAGRAQNMREMRRFVAILISIGSRGRRAMKSTIVKRSIVVAGHKTSVSLEDAFWRGLKEVAGERHMTLSELVGSIDSGRQHGNLSSAIRLFVLNHYRSELEGDISARPATGDLMAAQVA